MAGHSICSSLMTLIPRSGRGRRLFREAFRRRVGSAHGVALLLVLGALLVQARAEPGTSAELPSWNAGANRDAIVTFVQKISTPGTSQFVPAPERIAVFDNDGTLWAEQPLYFQVMFMLEQVKAAAPRHPEWKSNPAFKAIATHDEAAMASVGLKPILQLLAQANSGMSTTQYDAEIRQWLATARHPKFDRPYTDLVYVPMQELLEYLRAHGFKTFIVTGGSAEFMRPWAEKAYGIPPEQIVGSVSATKFQLVNGVPMLIRLPKIDFVNDGPGKPVGIYRSIGRQPIFAFGNSDGDLQMLQWTAGGMGARFIGLLHHTDAQREFAYDRHSKVGKLDKALDEAHARGWTVVDMQRDWRRVFGFE